MKHDEPIAIVGIGCRFPGGANNPQEFWKVIRDGIDTITDIPKDRWDIRTYYHPEPGRTGKTYARWGGFINGIDQFDPHFFGISSREAIHIDPQQRLLLEVAWEALDDGGQVLDRAHGARAGVFMGISTNDYTHMRLGSGKNSAFETHTATGSVVSMAANRISYCLNLTGPSVSIDTACSSSLVAVHLACESIWNSECTMALAGGVNVIIIPDPYLGFCKLSMLSLDGRCKTFDARADGFVRGEGAGVVVLKPLSDALNAGDPIYAVIRATGVNQDGRTAGITVPSEQAQAALLKEVYGKVGVSPATIQYVEAHGTGTPVGDPIEANAIGSVLGRDRPDGDYCIIGSVKTNIGHLEAGAGIAGLIKAALSLKYRQIAPNLHFETPNPNIPFEDLRLRVAKSAEPWPATNGPARAAVNSFGFGGTNAHIFLEEAPNGGDLVGAQPECSAERHYLLPLSARKAEVLSEVAKSYLDFLNGEGADEAVSLYDICHTSVFRRFHHEHRLTAVVRSMDDLREQLEAFVNGEKRPGLFASRQPGGGRPKLAFVCSGQGPQWWAMGRQLLESEPVFRAKIEECDGFVRELGSWSLIEELTADEDRSRMDRTDISQPSIFALQVALAALWKSWGISPDAIVGHSVGEVAAAHLSGALSLRDAVRAIYHRGRCMALAPETGKMLAVGLPAEEARELLRNYNGEVSLAAVNSPSSVTLSGEPGPLEEIAAVLEGRQVFCRFLRVKYAFHSRQMDPIQGELLQSLEGLECRCAELPLYSTVTGEAANGLRFDADYWWRNVRQSVRFGDAICALIEDETSVFLELSPHPVLSSSVIECFQKYGRTGTVLPSLRRKEDERITMLGSLGALHGLGFEVDWESLYPRPSRYLRLPSYPWSHDSYWRESDESREARFGLQVHPLLGKSAKSSDPCWTVDLDMGLLGYVMDHCVQGHPVFPASGYVEAALACARETLGHVPCVLEEIEFQRALFLPADNSEGSDTLQLQLSFHPQDASYQISSKPRNTDRNWTLNSCGRLRMQQGVRPLRKESMEDIRARCQEEISPKDCYQRSRKMGMHFGPAFQGIERLWRRDGEALGRIRIQESLEDGLEHYRCHPAVLDACFQVLGAAVPTSVDPEYSTLYLPAFIEQVRYYSPPGPRPYSHAKINHGSEKSFEGDVWVYDEQGNLALEILGFRCQAVEGARMVAGENLDDWCYKVRWQLKDRSDGETGFRSAAFLPSPSQLHGFMKDELESFTRFLPWGNRFNAIAPDVNALCSAYIVQAFRKLGMDMSIGQRMTLESLCERLGISAQHQRVVNRYLEMLEEDGLLAKHGPEWEVRSLPCDLDTREMHAKILTKFPSFYAEMALLGKCGPRIAEAMRGEVNPLELIFPEGSMDTAEHMYQDSPSFLSSNMLVEAAVSKIAESLVNSRKLRVLEIGGGTGSMTSFVLTRLPADRTEYVFTDMSGFFFSRCEQKFQDFPFVEYRVLDIEQDPREQGFTPHSFDLILASDVLHATEDLRQALGNVKELLASDGLLIFIELVKSQRFVDLIFGLTEGWWRFKDHDLRPEYPLLSLDDWSSLLEGVGFTEVRSLDPESGQASVVARGPTLSKDNDHPCGEVECSAPEGTWLVFADSTGITEKFASFLTGNGQQCVMVSQGEQFARIGVGRYSLSALEPEDMSRLIAEIRDDGLPPICDVLHLWSLDSLPPGQEPTADLLDAAQGPTCYSVLHLIQALMSSENVPSPRLWIVTRGAQPVDAGHRAISMEQAPLWGMSRVMGMEYHDLRYRMIDISHEPSEIEMNSLIKEILGVGRDDPEREVVLRGESRYVPRLVRTSVFRSSREDIRPVQEVNLPFRLETASPGILDSLTLRPFERRKPGPGQVEIEVATAALNFRDVMKGLGIYPTEDESDMLLGDECAGTVVAVGDGVDHVRVGDDVMAVAPGSFGSHVTTHAALVAPKPISLNLDEAATVPIAFLTACYALQSLGRIREGERVLIHAATGGVGLAAIQIAKSLGAEVFATAGSPEKREFLASLGVRHIMDSRSLAFADQVMEITGGRGVDLVLNSLAGQAIWKSLSVLGPYGRFLEIGKRDIYQDSRLGMRAFRKNISFFAIDLARILAERPEVVASLFHEIVRQFESGKFHPLPYRLFRIGRIVRAFRHMAQAKHIGKVVIAGRDSGALMEVLPRKEIDFPSDATYFITGGLGGFSLAIAQWLVEKGARNLVLMSRSGAPSLDAESIIQSMRGKGALVHIVKGDVSVLEDTEQVINEIRRSMPPLRGVFHAAMVMDDGVLLQQNKDRFRAVMAPKMLGAWNLHSLTRDDPLDLFVMFSSFASTTGNPGQSNYAAANSFLDSFAHYRRHLGLPAITVNWGQISDVGYVARHATLREHLKKLGVQGMGPQQAMRIFGRILQKNPPLIAVNRSDWRLWSSYYPKAREFPFFTYMVEGDGLDGQSSDGAVRIRDVLLGAKPEDRPDLIESYLRDQVARVLATAAAKLDPAQPISELGLDSLMAVELKNRVESEMGVSVPTVEIMRGPSIIELAKLLLSQLSQGECPMETTDAAGPVAEESEHRKEGESAEEALTKIDQLSDDEVDSLLRDLVEEEDISPLLTEQEKP